jgi:heat shock protein HslJ
MFGLENNFSHAANADVVAPGDDLPLRAKLEDMDWKFIRFGDESATEAREPTDIYLRLRSKGNGMRLFDGCNVIFGRYQLDAQKLRFLIAGVTEWECTRAMEERRQLLKVLQASSRWNILGEHLELYGSRSNLLAQFEAPRLK